MKLSEVLRKVADHEEPGVPWDWLLGICTNIETLTKSDASVRRELQQHGNDPAVREKLDKWLRQHPDFSGRGIYPIRHCPDALHGRTIEGGNGSYIAYHEYSTDIYTGTYGKKRREMALYLSILFAAEGL